MATPKRSTRLLTVLELEQRKEDAAREALSRSHGYLDQQKKQLESLETYRQQYLQTMKAQMSQVSSVGQLQTFQGFVNQLDQALAQQQQVLAHAQAEYDRVKDIWRIQHEKTKGIKDLYERIKNEEQLARDKKEEKRLEDDFLTRRRFL